MACFTSECTVRSLDCARVMQTFIPKSNGPMHIYITIDPCILRLIPSNILYINKHIIHTIPATLKLYRYSLPTNPIQAYKPI